MQQCTTRNDRRKSQIGAGIMTGGGGKGEGSHGGVLLLGVVELLLAALQDPL